MESKNEVLQHLKDMVHYFGQSDDPISDTVLIDSMLRHLVQALCYITMMFLRNWVIPERGAEGVDIQVLEAPRYEAGVVTKCLAAVMKV
jgi:hypothetical protein